MDNDLVIDFSSAGNLPSYVANGFSFGEPTGRWSVGASSLIVLPNLQQIEKLELSLRVWRAIGSPVHLGITVNNVAHLKTIIAGPAELVVPIKPEALVESSDIRLSFSHAPVGDQDSDETGHVDPRPLAVFFQTLILRQISKPTPETDAAQFSSVFDHQEGARITKDVSDFLGADDDRRLQIFGAAARSTPAPLIADWLLPSDLVQEHQRAQQIREIWVYGIRNAEVWGNGWVRRNRRLLLLPDCFPEYFASELTAAAGDIPAVWKGALGAASPHRVHFDGPVASVMHPNIVYGHFLLEIMPKLYVLSVLSDWVGQVPVLLSRHVPEWVKFFVSTLLGEHSIRWYDHRQDFVTAETVIVPSMMQVDYSFHPAMNSAVQALLQRTPSRPIPASGGYPARLYLSRTRMPGPKRIENEEYVEEAMSRLGFTILHPQEMSLPDQLAHYRSARIMVGDFSSALHNALFMNQGTGVVSINFFNAYQSAIARVRNQKIAFVPPADGKFRHWRLEKDLPRQFQVDCSQLVEIVRQMIASVNG